MHTEAICLTKFMNPADMGEWLDWHIYHCKFDHIHVIDNDSSFDLESFCRNYGNRVSYEKISGRPRQYIIYEDYINNWSNADWIMPIDDDEFLDISTEFNSVADALQYYIDRIPNMEMLAVRWKHLFPDRFKTERNGKVLDYCKHEHLTYAGLFQPIGDCGVKTFIHRSGKVHYQETTENPNGGHVPIHEHANYAHGFNGQHVNGLGFTSIPDDRSDEKIRLIHCRYKGYSEYVDKYITHTNNRISDMVPRKKNFLFNMLLPKLA